LELLFLELPLLLPQPEFGQHRLVRIDDHHAAVAVHDQQLAFADQRTSVMKLPKRCCLNRITSAGDRSCATRIVSSSLCAGAGILRGCPVKALSTRSTTCTTSALRSRR